jgi:hypothetical protein
MGEERPKMEESTEIVELLIAISHLPEDRRRRRNSWYESQKEHWMGWLFHYNSPGAYNRKTTQGRDARFVYNHIVCPGLLTYLADASGVSRRLVGEARRIEKMDKTEMQRAGEIRRIIPWGLVHGALVENGYLRSLT